jgi:hypothetical protein
VLKRDGKIRAGAMTGIEHLIKSLFIYRYLVLFF